MVSMKESEYQVKYCVGVCDEEKVVDLSNNSAGYNHGYRSISLQVQFGKESNGRDGHENKPIIHKETF